MYTRGARQSEGAKKPRIHLNTFMKKGEREEKRSRRREACRLFYLEAQCMREILRATALPVMQTKRAVDSHVAHDTALL